MTTSGTWCGYTKRHHPSKHKCRISWLLLDAFYNANTPLPFRTITCHTLFLQKMLKNVIRKSRHRAVRGESMSSLTPRCEKVNLGQVQSTIGSRMLPLDKLASDEIIRNNPTYATMFAHPIRRQCFSIRRDKATFSPISVQAGEVSDRRAASALTAMTLAPVAVEPMLTIWVSLASFGPQEDKLQLTRTSCFESLATLACFPSAVLTPSNLLRRK